MCLLIGSSICKQGESPAYYFTLGITLRLRLSGPVVSVDSISSLGPFPWSMVSLGSVVAAVLGTVGAVVGAVVGIVVGATVGREVGVMSGFLLRQPVNRLAVRTRLRIRIVYFFILVPPLNCWFKGSVSDFPEISRKENRIFDMNF